MGLKGVNMCGCGRCSMMDQVTLFENRKRDALKRNFERHKRDVRKGDEFAVAREKIAKVLAKRRKWGHQRSVEAVGRKRNLVVAVLKDILPPTATESQAKAALGR